MPAPDAHPTLGLDGLHERDPRRAGRVHVDPRLPGAPGAGVVSADVVGGGPVVVPCVVVAVLGMSASQHLMEVQRLQHVHVGQGRGHSGATSSWHHRQYQRRNHGDHCPL
ncbi:hypothetical protein [Arthrobacter sp. efr-133-TYG-118]|uniref:hypothetical protein n=1 Tax=Arthrobacter sp. efr-133-TYG-118 TaxID=3040279 RepID=UPI00254EE455|nr:hypothetical protein [Arthrobacter sp. efr-133-TYG-118]